MLHIPFGLSLMGPTADINKGPKGDILAPASEDAPGSQTLSFEDILADASDVAFSQNSDVAAELLTDEPEDLIAENQQPSDTTQDADEADLSLPQELPPSDEPDASGSTGHETPLVAINAYPVDTKIDSLIPKQSTNITVTDTPAAPSVAAPQMTSVATPDTPAPSPVVSAPRPTTNAGRLAVAPGPAQSNQAVPDTGQRHSPLPGPAAIPTNSAPCAAISEAPQPHGGIALSRGPIAPSMPLPARAFAAVDRPAPDTAAPLRLVPANALPEASGPSTLAAQTSEAIPRSQPPARRAETVPLANLLSPSPATAVASNTVVAAIPVQPPVNPPTSLRDTNSSQATAFEPESLSELRSMPELQAAHRTPSDTVLARPELPRHLSQQLAQAMQHGGNRPVELHLNPVELGRVKISLQTSDGSVTVHIMADRPETLDLMRRHMDLLAQDFRAIGFNKPQFSFAQNGSGEGGGHFAAPHGQGSDRPAPPGLLPETEPTTSPPALHITDRVDIRV